MKHVTHAERQTRTFPTIAQIMTELDKDLKTDTVKKQIVKPSGKEVILAVLDRAAEDHKFLARLAEDPSEALSEYDLTLEEKAALGSGDIRKIELWVGKLDKRQSTWINCRLQQEKW